MPNGWRWLKPHFTEVTECQILQQHLSVLLKDEWGSGSGTFKNKGVMQWLQQRFSVQCCAACARRLA
ncbi:hypothetical protein Ct61P_02931 [Colletotrichum tofieldiae]|nr:hypothetical protein Ct61P_02931 [Colletotrichum tofieldiae]